MDGWMDGWMDGQHLHVYLPAYPYTYLKSTHLISFITFTLQHTEEKPSKTNTPVIAL